MTEHDPSRTDRAVGQAALRAALATLLASAGGDPRPEDLADVLWISRLTGVTPLPGSEPATTPTAPPAAPPPPGRTPEPPAAGRPPAEGEPPGRPAPEAAPEAAAEAEPKVELHSHHTPEPVGPAAARSGQVVQVTRPTALPGALDLARALRPLRRPLNNAVGGPDLAGLDEEATAETTAEVGVLVPVWHQERQPRFSVDLLVDTGATMAVWTGLAGELATLLERHGAFADVRSWALDTDGPVPRLAAFRRRRHAARAGARPTVEHPHWTGPLADPLGRRILLVLTDGVGPAWYGEELPAFLARAVTGRPVAALQVLPRRLWHRTALRPAPVEGRAATDGRTAPVFRPGAAFPGVPLGAAGSDARAAMRWLPILEIDADWLTPWAGLAAGRTTGWTPMLAAPLRGVPRPSRPARDTDTRPPAADRVAAFRAGSSPNAYRLACHLAAAPLSLPVMRLVQRATVPDSGQTDLAELFLSGLLEIRTEAADPDEVVYDFGDGVREELLAELTRSESVRVLEHVLAKVSGRVAATFGGTLDFRALAASAEADGRPLPAKSRPFAEVAVAVLAGAGGQHATVSRRLRAAVDGAAGAGSRVDGPGPTLSGIRRELLNPVPPIVSPPDPPRMIGRRDELGILTRACVAEPTITYAGFRRPAMVVVRAANGLGRRRLVQEYVQRHGARHSVVHWIDGRGPSALRAGLEQLRSALTPAAGGPESPVPLAELVADHPGWLIVIDHFRPPVDPGRSGVDPRDFFGLADGGPGCLLLTTAAPVTGEFPDNAEVINLGPLSDGDLLEEIRLRSGAAYPRIERTAQLGSLLARMPRHPEALGGWDLDAELAALIARVDSAEPSEEPSGALSAVRSFPLPSPAVAVAAIPGSFGKGRIAVCGADGLVRFLDAADGRQAADPIALDTADVAAMAAIEDSEGRGFVATASSGGQINFWNAANGALYLINGRDPGLAAMAGYTDVNGRRYLWTSDRTGRMRLWDPDNGESVASLGGTAAHRATVVPHSAGASAVLDLGPDGQVRHWRPGRPDGLDLRTIGTIDPVRARQIAGIASDEDRCVIASIGDLDDRVHIWELYGSAYVPDAETEEPDEDTTRVVGGRYRLLQPIAQGGEGELWHAEALPDRSRVVVKLIPRRDGGVDQTTDFGRRATALARLRHPGIVALHDAGILPDAYYLVMEHVEGGDLRSLLDAGPVGVAHILAIGRQVADALEYLHGHGIVHYDVKPANILVRTGGEAVLCDFGFGWLAAEDQPGDVVTSRASGRGRVPMTPRYMAPEQASGGWPGPRTDLYSLGCVLYELATGQPPFTETSTSALMQHHTHTVPEPPDRSRPDLPGDLTELIQELLEKDPEQRPVDAAEVSRRLGLLESVRPQAPGSDLRLTYSVLGGLQVLRGRNRVRLGSAEQSALLATLIGYHGAPLTLRDLVDSLWDRADAPRLALDTVQEQLRILGELLNRPSPRNVLVRSADGSYALEFDAADVDAERFEDRIALAEAALTGGDLRKVLEYTSAALAMWQGTPLADVQGPYALRERARLQGLYERARGLRFEAEVGLGNAAAVLPELRQFAVDNPPNTQAQRALMLALHRTGRTDEALAHYGSVRRYYEQELGSRPEPRLTELRDRIIREDPELLLLPTPPEDVERTTHSGAEELNLRFTLLGPLRAWRDGRQLRLGPPQQQAVLAALLLNAGQPMSMQTLVDAVWGDQPPGQPERAVSTYVSHLRSVIEDGAVSQRQSRVVQTVDGGYLARIPAGSDDLSVFNSNLAKAASMRATGEPHGAHLVLHTALLLWQGEPLAGIPGPYAAQQRALLAGRRLDASEEMYAVALEVGQHEEVVTKLGALAAEEPERWRLHALLMLALTRCGRRWEAIAAFESVRERLTKEFGRAPSSALTALHERILAADPELMAPGNVDELLDRIAGQS
ncbi:hypothetical protein GCM10010193_16910 [Kitasatospora atroaurantiaca]|uniref:Serine/threonine protein kinase n=1 Tax=Kitasatospora atroaurantiaca TaxID=285545 RepID=A0A561EXB9_9ACTN|nr:SAV_2336 N-terminal domain-related protein [Kitasatospora atroaurantiaca]TWE20253.1 serine/threonine protein kinase [Kitasatospora atroaurantiaca]